MWKQKGKVLQLVTGARPPCPTLVGSGYQQVGDRNSLPRTSLVTFHRSTSGCDALFISISLEFAFKIFFFFSLGFPKSFISWLKYESLQYLTLCKMGCWQRWVSWGTGKGQPSSALELLLQHQCLTGTQVSTQKQLLIPNWSTKSKKTEY